MGFWCVLLILMDVDHEVGGVDREDDNRLSAGH